ncbi:MAG: PQQ-dependent sugar dehydrogenase [Phenylobacterium sp.]|uniref:PQQ-dependent sugar dehydrogenase n=1 Tax=Phenylobacterium sp. TaxID=1871053 RepID=UPI001B4CE439|nr:PQQ-dependent sugar dehydrogenase [Phenylobacterium sp.]MBP7648836.1 PQQ-dependent sugar dehydrogenase [Phenylobacterium sp.]MBP7815290.1 PQQ-dependent sugar dehydrogenase [Phenylobacterium sp.]MBP9232239.1 PQQ-dependent sugar dehydrogenase [Phenylobacterium sp.]MBP9755607.1 PQQ-dependent sugar dehydrogenase [Phenylobacterium sp.]
MRRLLFTAAVAALVSACGPSQAAPGAPVETRPANAPNLKPAFENQTRAPEMKAGVEYEVKTVAEGLANPWAIAFLPDGKMLVSEKPGRLRIVGADGALSEPVAGLPAVYAKGQGGLLGLAIDPAYAKNGLIYWSYAENPEGKFTNTAVARGKLVVAADGSGVIENAQVIFHQAPSLESTLHYGGRLVFAPDGKLFITLGERSILPGRVQAEQLDGLLGKIVRLNSDGSVPKDNPFVGKAGARPEIWSYGHRNVQGAALNPATGKLWTTEHGARGGDELNIPQAGKDYGWPTITYGIEYQGGAIGEGIGAKAGLEQPIYYWDPVIAPSGLAFYNAGLFPKWKGSLFAGGLAGKSVTRLTLDGEKVVGEERIVTELDERIRDVVVGPDGALYLATDSAEGRILKLVPKG